MRIESRHHWLHNGLVIESLWELVHVFFETILNRLQLVLNLLDLPLHVVLVLVGEFARKLKLSFKGRFVLEKQFLLPFSLSDLQVSLLVIVLSILVQVGITI